MISLAEARTTIARQLSPLSAVATGLDDAFGRVLRQDVLSTEDLPAFDRSAMDGYAVNLDDDSTKFRVVGEVRPGGPPELVVHRGECARIFTGSPIPAGASQVLMQEHVTREAEFITPTQRSRATFIRRRGEDARQRDCLLNSGTRLGAGELALLASLGVVQPQVSPRCRVAHFTTGDELVEPAQSPAVGQLRDSNSTLVAAIVRQFGGELVRQERVPDDFELLQQRVRALHDGFDLLLMSGGASVGDYDFGSRLLTASGFEIHFSKINLRPGKPLIFGTRGNTAAFVLPGNPVSHFVTMHTAVRVAFETFAGAALHWPQVRAKLAEGFEYRPDARETLWPARTTLENGELAVRALRWQSSGDVTGLTGANALLHFTGGDIAPVAGNVVNTLLLELP